MNKTLPSVITLIKESWNQFKNTWNESSKVSMWILYLSLVSFFLSIIEKFAPNARTWLFPIDITIAVISIWVGIRMMQVMLDIEDGKKPNLTKEIQKKAWSLFWPMLWIGLLQGIVTLGGVLLLIIPGIFIGFAVTFAPYYLLDENKRGLTSLSASLALVKGRWWATWWRLFAGNMIIGLGIVSLIVLANICIGLAIGQTNFMIAIRNPQLADPLVIGIQNLIEGIISAAFLPFITLYSVKVFRALEKSR
ncbi:hypothetical protein IT408_04470 [Candidatus Uhrbacteria bacterium]|nr:hypothetical protein [Candidatus Uhrbacteria bacterium]